MLDATFDSLVPLAVPRMPASMSGLVERAVRNDINLNVGEQLAKFSGPVRLVRRANDEMICTRYRYRQSSSQTAHILFFANRISLLL